MLQAARPGGTEDSLKVPFKLFRVLTAEVPSLQFETQAADPGCNRGQQSGDSGGRDRVRENHTSAPVHHGGRLG